MEAGRELDALVAEKVMGWRWCADHGPDRMLVPPDGDPRQSWCADWDEDGLPDWLPKFSTEIQPAMSVFERFRPYIKLDALGTGTGRDVVCRIWTGYGPEEDGSVSAAHAEIPMAIVLAGLKAVGCEVPA